MKIDTTHRLHIPEMSDILLVHSLVISVRFQVHVDLQDSVEIRASFGEHAGDVLECLGLAGSRYYVSV